MNFVLHTKFDCKACLEDLTSMLNHKRSTGIITQYAYVNTHADAYDFTITTSLTKQELYEIVTAAIQVATPVEINEEVN